MLTSFVLDAADREKFDAAQKELHDLVKKPTLGGIPLLVLGNKNDLKEAATLEEIARAMFFLICFYGLIKLGTLVKLLGERFLATLFLPRIVLTLISHWSGLLNTARHSQHKY